MINEVRIYNNYNRYIGVLFFPHGFNVSNVQGGGEMM